MEDVQSLCMRALSGHTVQWPGLEEALTKFGVTTTADLALIDWKEDYPDFSSALTQIQFRILGRAVTQEHETPAKDTSARKSLYYYALTAPAVAHGVSPAPFFASDSTHYACCLRGGKETSRRYSMSARDTVGASLGRPLAHGVSPAPFFASDSPPCHLAHCNCMVCFRSCPGELSNCPAAFGGSTRQLRRALWQILRPALQDPEAGQTRVASGTAGDVEPGGHDYHAEGSVSIRQMHASSQPNDYDCRMR